MLELAAAFICLTTLMTYFSYRFTNLPPAIGVMATVGVLLSTLMIAGMAYWMLGRFARWHLGGLGAVPAGRP